jgi:HSP20 family molecular chaperone IbpA
MMYYPDLFNGSLFDDWMDSIDKNMKKYENDENRALYGHRAKDLMKTDVHEKDGNYIVDIDLPGFKKEDIDISLQDGNLTITTNKSLDKDETDKKGNVIRQERYAGNMTRSFYVGENLRSEDIHAKFENGVLTLTIPAKKEEVHDTHSITIE